MTSAVNRTDRHVAPRSRFAPGAPGNAELEPIPRLDMPPGEDVGALEFDFPAVRVGVAQYTEGPTGCTVIHLPGGARTAVDARGGAVGMSGGYDVSHAICFAGGSVYGLGAAAGVSEGILAGHENRTDWEHLALVSGAVVYDLSVRDNAVVPDAALGRSALAGARPGRFPIGRCGAGVAASVGKVDPARTEFSGQGAAFAVHGGVRVLVATVVNAVGVIVDRDATIVRGNRDPLTGVRRHLVEDYAELIGHPAPAPALGNTTVTALVTDARLTDRELAQLATQVHASMHRAIQPFQTESDGDVLFAATTDEVELLGVGSTGLGALASEVAWDAVLSSVRPNG